MNLNLFERLAVREYIPQKGFLADMKEVRVIKELLAFTGEEIKEFEIKEAVLADGRPIYDWDHVKSQTYFVDIPFTQWITEKVRTGLRNAELEGKLPIEHLTLYEKFIELYQND
jgi:hypothetical protein